MTDTTRDETLWAQYAAVALPALIRDAEDDDVVEDVTASARGFADAMLAETRKRFPSAPTEAPQEPAPAFKVGDRVRVADDSAFLAGRVGRVIAVDAADDVQWCFVEADTSGEGWFRSNRLALEPAPATAQSAIGVASKTPKGQGRYAVLTQQGYEDMAATLRSLADRLERAIGGGR